MKKALISGTIATGIGAVAWHYAPRALKAIVKGNLSSMDPERSTLNVKSPLFNKKIGFLGSSITYGAAAGGVSFVEYLQFQDGVVATKSAISGTTLAGNQPKTYVSRLVSDFDPTEKLDLFVCQLSTNDDRAKLAMGNITPDNQKSGFNKETTLGAIEYICSYVKEHFDCPVVFYTRLRKKGSSYDELVAKLYELKDKWDIKIIDLWAGPVVNSLSTANPNAMFDDAHPTKQGYKNIWTPIFEKKLPQFLQK